MKTVDEAPESANVALADYKEDIQEVLESVDKQLAEHGLEVVLVDNGSDDYEWYIQKRGKG